MTQHTNHPLHPFERGVENDWPATDWCQLSVLVAVSSGPDSVALLRALSSLRRNSVGSGSIQAAHFNHGWRAEASDQDQMFVHQLCERLSIPLHVCRSSRSIKKEETARTERYDFLKSKAEELGARYLAMGHNANDQAETILHRIIRGTALRGLSGIPARRRMGEAVTICRPILWASRQEVMDYLQTIDQPFRVDESNADKTFTRNRIRHDLLPQLAIDYNSGVIQSLLRLGTLAAETNQFVDQEVQRLVSTCVLEQNHDLVRLARATLLDASPFLLRETLIAVWRSQGWPEQSMGFDQWDGLGRAIRTGATICLPGKIRLTTNGNAIQLTRFDS